MIKIHFPISSKEQKDILLGLKAGELLEISGTIYTARDQAHKRLLGMIRKEEQLPIPIEGQAIYYCGPTPVRDDGLFGSAGPTTSARMDPFTPTLLEMGLSATIGKGGRSSEIAKAIAKHGSVYLATFGGAGAYLAKCIVAQSTVAFPELGAEAIYRLEVENFPAIVAIDGKGNSIYE